MALKTQKQYKNNETKNYYQEKINEINKSLDRLKKKKETQITNIWNEKET